MAIGAKSDFHGPKPRIITGHEIGELSAGRGGALINDQVSVQSRRHDVAAEHLISQRHDGRLRRNMYDSADRGAAVQVVNHRRQKPEPVVRTAKTGITSAANELRDRLAVTVSGIAKSPVIGGHPKRIDLAVRDHFDAAAIRSKAKRISGT